MFNWIYKRLFSSENIGYLVEQASPIIQERIKELSKDAIFEMLHDEEFLEQVTGLGDALYNRYMQKFGGFLGGKQKGINYAMEDANPLNQIFDDDGNISLPGIVKGFLSGNFKNAIGGQSGVSSSVSSRKALKYE